jgi:cell division septation protein DedD
MTTTRIARLVAIALSGAFIVAAELPAQTSGTPYQRAERLVREGRGAEGRAIVDSVLKSMPDDTPEYAEGLYWRATLASDAADAERDYRRIIVEYPLSSRSEDALINLAQLELARGDRPRAIATLERFEREHPNSSSRARVTLWRARALFDSRNEPAACAAVATARSRVGDGDVELRNQIDFLAPRCVGVDTTRAVASAGTAGSTRGAGSTTPAGAARDGAGIGGASRTGAGTSAGEGARAREVPTVTPSAPAPDRAAPRTGTAGSSGQGAPARNTTTSGNPAPAVPARGTAAAGSPSEGASARTTPPQPSTQGRAAAGNAPAVARFAVQVAAYSERADADKLVERLAARGHEARVVGTAKPFRVWVGRYATRAEADAAQVRMRSANIIGFVTEAEGAAVR